MARQGKHYPYFDTMDEDFPITRGTLPTGEPYQDVGGFALPTDEKHVPDWMRGNRFRELVKGRLHYQYQKQRKFYAAIPPNRRRYAIDVGAHVGLWAWHLADEFEFVQCVEPLPLHLSLLAYNMRDKDNWGAAPFALGDRQGKVLMEVTPRTSVAAHVSEGGSIFVDMVRLDDMDVDPYLDLIKIDVEGYEERVIMGAERTIKKHSPYVILEQRGHDEDFHGFRVNGAGLLLHSWGYHDVVGRLGHSRDLMMAKI